MRPLLLFFCLEFLLFQQGFAVDPVEELKSFSAFPKIDLREPEEEKIWVEEGPSMEFSRGISGQACFVVMAPAEKTARLFQTYDSSSHESLKVYFHGLIQTPPSDKDFDSLGVNSEKSYFRRLVAKTRTTKPDQPDFHLTLVEARQIAESMKTQNNPSETAIRCWQKILTTRASTFQNKGIEGAAPYETAKSSITVASEIQSLLGEDSKVLKQFSPILSATLFAKQPPKLEVDPCYYLELLDVDHRATFNLGAAYYRASDDRYQIVDCTYYSSGGFYAACTLAQIWPMKVKDKDASLVWLERLVSAASLADRKGIEAMAAPGVLLQEIKKWIRAFQEDITKGKISR